MLLLFVVSLLWALSFGIIKRWLPGVDSAFVATARLGLSLLVFIPFLRLRGIGWRHAAALIAIGAVQFGLMYLAYLASFPYLGAYEVALFTITTPILVTFFADLLDGCLRPPALLAALLAVIGAGFIVARSTDFRLTLAGFGLVQLSNAAFALGQVLYRRVRVRASGQRDRDVFGLLYLGGFAVALAVLLIRDVTVVLGTPQLLALVYLGVIASGLGFFLWNVGATRVNTGALAVMNNAKIPLAVACSLLLFGEHTSLPRLLAGGAVMAAAAWLAQRRP